MLSFIQSLLIWLYRLNAVNNLWTILSLTIIRISTEISMILDVTELSNKQYIFVRSWYKEEIWTHVHITFSIIGVLKYHFYTGSTNLSLMVSGLLCNFLHIYARIYLNVLCSNISFKSFVVVKTTFPISRIRLYWTIHKFSKEGLGEIDYQVRDIFSKLATEYNLLKITAYHVVV